MDKKNSKESKENGRIKTVIRIIAAFTAAILLILAALPSLLSSQPAQPLLRKLINNRLRSQQVSWKNVTLSWTAGQQIEQVKYSSDSLMFSADSIATEKGLTAFLRKTVNFGTLLINRPRFEYITAEEPQAVTTAKQTPSSKKNTQQQPPSNDQQPSNEHQDAHTASIEEKQRISNDFKGRIRLLDGHISVRNSKGTRAMAWHSAELKADIPDGLRNECSITFSAEQRVIEQTGLLRINATINPLQPDGTFNIEKLKTDLNISATDIDTGAISWIGTETVGFPALRGKLSMDCLIKAEGISSYLVNLNTSLEEAIAAGGSLGNDLLNIGNADITIRGRRQAGRFLLENASLNNRLLSFKCSGDVQLSDNAEAYPAGTAHAEMNADLAGIAMQLRETLSLQKDLKLDNGLFNADMKIESDSESISLLLSAACRNLHGSRNNQVLAIKKPIIFNLKAAYKAGQPQIEDISLETDFAKASGKGNLDDFSIMADVDLGAAWQTITDFIDMGPAKINGRVYGSGRISTQNEFNRRIYARLDATGLNATSASGNSFSIQKIKAETAGLLKVDINRRPEEVRDIRWLMTADPFEASGVIEKIDLISDQFSVSGINLRWTAELDKLFNLLHAAGRIPDDVFINGKMNGSCVAEINDRLIDISLFDTTVTNLVVESPGAHITEPLLALRASAQIPFTPATEAATITKGILQTSAFTMTFPAIRLTKGLSSPQLTAGQIDLDIDFNALSAMLSNSPPFSDGYRLDGNGKIKILSAPSGTLANGINVKVDASAENISINRPQMNTFHEPHISITAQLAWNQSEGSLQIEPLKIDSGMLILDAKALLLNLGVTPSIELDATVTSDLSNAADLLSTVAGTRIDISGHNPITLLWKGQITPEWQKLIRTADGTGEFTVDHISALGMNVNNTRIQMRAIDGRMIFALNAALNDGRVELLPALDVTGAVPRLTMPENATVLHSVRLTDAMASELLALIHPVLRGCSVLGGTTDLHIERCRIPLEGDIKLNTDIRGEFILNNLRIAPAGLLLEIMQAAKIKSESVNVLEQHLRFKVENGRIYPSPLTFNIDGNQVTLDGSIGLDSSLQYNVEIPVTEELAGRKAFRYLKDTNIKLPVSGTAVRPVISAQAVAKATAELVADAARNAIKDESKEVLDDLQKKGEDALKELLERKLR